MKALDLPLAHLADLGDAYLAELDGLAADAEAVRRHWLQQTAQAGDARRHGLARARLAVNLVAQGAHRVAEGELRLAERDLLAWADAALPEEAAWQLAVVACAWALIDAQLSVRAEPARERAALALAACGQALEGSAPGRRAALNRDLLPWALATASAWITVLDEATPAGWQTVFEAVEPVLAPALAQADAGAVDWLLAFAHRVRSLGPLSDGLHASLMELSVGLAAAPALDLRNLGTPGAAAPPSRLEALRRAVPQGLAAGIGPPGPAANTPALAFDAPRRAVLDAWLALSRLPRTPAERQRMAGACMLLAQRLHPPGRRRAPGDALSGDQTQDRARAEAAASRLRLSAAQLWSQDGLWTPVLDALVLCARPGLPADSAATWRVLLHRLATTPAASTPLARARRRTAPLRRWLARQAPLPLDPVDEARWLADLASLDGRDADALQLRREALDVTRSERGAESFDALEALQALHGTLVQRDEAHPELEALSDMGLELALRLCGPMSPEHWWWRGVRALWWHHQGHPQALLDTAEEAEIALVQTIRHGDAHTCASLRALLEVAHTVPLPARSDAGITPGRMRVRLQ